MKRGDRGSSRARMGILYETAALLLVVLLLSGLAMFLILRKSQEQLSERSIDKLVETQARDFTSAFEFVVRELAKKYEARVNQELLLETFQAAQDGRISEAAAVDKPGGR